MKQHVVALLLPFAILMSCMGCAPGSKANVGTTRSTGGSAVVTERGDGTGDIRKSAKINESGIRFFRYSYDNSYGASSYYYEVDASGEKALLRYAELGLMSWEDYDDEKKALVCELDESFVEKLNLLYKNGGLASWDGYHETTAGVCDGDAFSLSIRFEDGGSLSASGSNCAPEGYGAFKERLQELFSPPKAQLVDAYIQSKRQEEITGELESMLFSIHQHGDSGSNEYTFMLCETGNEEAKNLDLVLKFKREAELPKGRYQYYGHVRDAGKWLREFREIFDANDVKQWAFWDKSAEDYNNREFFQLSFVFTSGQQVDAMGTLYPEHYDEVRAACMDVIGKIVKQYGVVAEKG